MPPVKKTRYQNISTVSTSVLRDTGGEPLSLPMPPRTIAELTEADVSLTKDRCNPRDRNPFDLGLVVAIPAGKREHPDVPPAPPTFSSSTIQKVMTDGTLDEIDAMLQTAQDTGHIQTFDRSLVAVRKGMSEDRVNDIDQLITDRRSELASATRKRGAAIDAKLRQPAI